MLTTCNCPHCKGLIEFQSGLVGQPATCPHCGQQMILHLPIPAPPKKKTPKGFRGRELLVILIFIAGVLFGINGVLAQLVAKSAMHETTAAIYICNGAILCALSIVGSILITIGENASKK